MFLTVDIDNFNIKFCIISNDSKIVTKFVLPFVLNKNIEQFIINIQSAFDKAKVDISKIIYIGILSSIPKFERVLTEFFEKYFRIKPFIIDVNTIATNIISNDIKDIKEVPLSTLVLASAAINEYQDNLIIVNCDSFVSFGVIINKMFCGYAIYPGIEMLSSVLNKEMSIFPDIFIEKTNKFFDNNNYDSLNCCVFNGFICTIDGIISGIKNTFPKNTFDVIITGRNIDIVANYSKEITNVDENLLIKGIILLTKNKLVVF